MKHYATCQFAVNLYIVLVIKLQVLCVNRMFGCSWYLIGSSYINGGLSEWRELSDIFMFT